MNKVASITVSIIVLAVVLLFATQAVQAAEWGPSVPTSIRGTRDAAYLEANVADGRKEFTGFEDTCTNRTDELRKKHAGNRSDSRQYWNIHELSWANWYIWISPKDNPSATQVTDVIPGSTDAIDLQLNYVFFACSTTLQGNNNSDTIHENLRVNSMQWANDIRQETSEANWINYATTRESHLLLESVGVASGDGTVQLANAGKYRLFIPRNTSSRYNFTSSSYRDVASISGSIGLQYTPPAGGFASDTTINVATDWRAMRIYDRFKTAAGDKTGSMYQEYFCTSAAGGRYEVQVGSEDGPVSDSRIRNCQLNSDDIKITVVLAEVWTIQPNVSVESITGTESTTQAVPGDTITWSHSVTNTGTNATSESVAYNYVSSEGIAGSGGDWMQASGLASDASSNEQTSTYAVTQDDVGERLCRATEATPGSSRTSDGIKSSAACVDIPYDYTLTPTINDPGEGTDIVGNIGNSGPTKSRSNTQWQLNRMVYPAGTTPNTAASNSPEAQVPCSRPAVAGLATECDILGSGTGTTITTSGRDVAATDNNTTEYDIGTKICYSLSVQPYSSSSTVWAHSAMVCRTVNKKPKIQVWGGNLIAETVDTSTTIKRVYGPDSDSVIFGSWSEYGILAPGTIAGMASASGLNSTTETRTSQSAWSKLTFGNTASSGSPAFGSYSNLAGLSLQDSENQTIVQSYGNQTGAPIDSTLALDLDVGILSSGVYTPAGTTLNLTAANTTIPSGRQVIINATGKTVTISGNIRYQDTTYTSIADIPQLIIIAEDINIAGNVTNIDAWLIAIDTLVTCSDRGTASQLKAITGGVITNSDYMLVAADCANQLTVNGPVAADKLWLRRTAGSGTGLASGDPAEVFNLRADAYLWASSQTSARAVYRSTYTKELPPRF